MDARAVIEQLRASGVLHRLPPRDDPRVVGLMDAFEQKFASRLSDEARADLDDLRRATESGDRGSGDLIRLIASGLIESIEAPPDVTARLRDPARFAVEVEDLQGQVNARAFAVSGSWLVLIDASMIQALYEVARVAVFRASSDETGPGCEACTEPTCDRASVIVTARRWFETLQRIATPIYTQVNEHWDPTAEQLLFANDLAVAGESFVVAHELGHHLAGHTEGAAVRALPDDDGGEEGISELVPTWDLEFEADAFAVDLVLRAAAREALRPDGTHDAWPFTRALMGIEHFFTTVEALHRIAETPDATPTHPPLLLRQALIRKTVESVYPSLVRTAAPARGISQLYARFWDTLANPTAHDAEGLEAERQATENRVLECMRDAARTHEAHPDDPAKSFDPLGWERWHGSKLLFDLATYRIANNLVQGTDKTVRRAAALASGLICDTPVEVVRALDLHEPFLGIAPQLDPSDPFPAIDAVDARDGEPAP